MQTKKKIDSEFISQSGKEVVNLISFTDILFIIAKHVRILFFVPMAFCVIVALYAIFFAKPIYKSSSKIVSYTESSSSNLSQAAGLAAQFGISLSDGNNDQQWAYRDIIKSRTLARAMLKNKYDTKEYGIQKTLLQILTYGNKKPTFGFDTLRTLATEALLKKIDVAENLKTGIYTITISGREPQFVYELNNDLIDALDNHQRNYYKVKKEETREFIESRIESTENELRVKEEALRNFMVQNRRIENSPNLQLEQARIQREVNVLTSVFTTLKQQLETAKIEQVKNNDYVIVIDPPEVPLYRAKPNKRLMVILAGIFGLVFGVFIIIFIEYFDKYDEKSKKKIIQAKDMIKQNLKDSFYLNR